MPTIEYAFRTAGYGVTSESYADGVAHTCVMALNLITADEMVKDLVEDIEPRLEWILSEVSEQVAWDIVLDYFAGEYRAIGLYPERFFDHLIKANS